MKIVSLTPDGPAAKAALRVGDIIIGVGNTPIQTFNDMRAQLGPIDGDVEIVFLNSENGKLEKLPVKAVNGKIGVNVEQVELPLPPPPAPKTTPASPPTTNS